MKGVLLGVCFVLVLNQGWTAPLTSQTVTDDDGTNWQISDFFSGFNIMNSTGITSIISALTSISKDVPTDDTTTTVPPPWAKYKAVGKGAKPMWGAKPKGSRDVPAANTMADEAKRALFFFPLWTPTTTEKPSAWKSKSKSKTTPATPADTITGFGMIFTNNISYPKNMMSPYPASSSSAFVATNILERKLAFFNALFEQMATSLIATTTTTTTTEATMEDNAEKSGILPPDFWVWNSLLPGTNAANTPARRSPKFPPTPPTTENIGALDPSVFIAKKIEYLKNMYTSGSAPTQPPDYPSYMWSRAVKEKTEKPTSKKGKQTTTTEKPLIEEEFIDSLYAFLNSKRAVTTSGVADTEATTKKPPLVLDVPVDFWVAPNVTTVDPTYYINKKMEFMSKLFDAVVIAQLNTTGDTTTTTKRSAVPVGINEKAVVDYIMGKDKKRAPKNSTIDIDIPVDFWVTPNMTIVDPTFFLNKKMYFLSKLFDAIVVTQATSDDDDTTRTARLVIPAPVKPTLVEPGFWAPLAPSPSPDFFISKKMDFLNKLFTNLSMMVITTKTPPVARETKDPLTDPRSDVNLLSEILQNTTGFEQKLQELEDTPKNTRGTVLTSPTLSPGIADLLEKMKEYRMKAGSTEVGDVPMTEKRATATGAAADSKALLTELKTLGKIMEQLILFQTKLDLLNNADDTAVPPKRAVDDTTGSPVTSKALLTELKTLGKIMDQLIVFQSKLDVLSKTEDAVPAKREVDNIVNTRAVTTSPITDLISDPDAFSAQLDALDQLVTRLAAFKKNLSVLIAKRAAESVGSTSPITDLISDPDAFSAQLDALDKLVTRLAAFKKNLSVLIAKRATETVGLDPAVASVQLDALSKLLKSLSDFQKKLATVQTTTAVPPSTTPFDFAAYMNKKKTFLTNIFKQAIMMKTTTAAPDVSLLAKLFGAIDDNELPTMEVQPSDPLTAAV